MGTPTKESLRNQEELAIAYAKKHWIVYSIPVLALAAGLYFLLQNETATKAIGFLLALSSLLRIVQVSTVKWYLTPQTVVVQQGWPWAKKQEQIPVFELYKSHAEPGKFSRFFNLGTLSAKRREQQASPLSHPNISNATTFAQEVEKIIERSPAHPLNTAFALKEKGIITQAEYELMKLGVVTHRYLA